MFAYVHVRECERNTLIRCLQSRIYKPDGFDVKLFYDLEKRTAKIASADKNGIKADT